MFRGCQESLGSSWVVRWREKVLDSWEVLCSHGLPFLLQVFLQSPSSVQLSWKERWTSRCPTHILRMDAIVIWTLRPPSKPLWNHLFCLPWGIYNTTPTKILKLPIALCSNSVHGTWRSQTRFWWSTSFLWKSACTLEPFIWLQAWF